MNIPGSSMKREGHWVVMKKGRRFGCDELPHRPATGCATWELQLDVAVEIDAHGVMVAVVRLIWRGGLRQSSR
jgi:hypothetical protein